MKFLFCVFAMMLPFCAMADIASTEYTDDKVDSARGIVSVIENGEVVDTAQIWIE